MWSTSEDVARPKMDLQISPRKPRTARACLLVMGWARKCSMFAMLSLMLVSRLVMRVSRSLACWMCLNEDVDRCDA